jgi:hypothetical protein
MARQWCTITLKDAYGRTTRMRREMKDQLLLLDYLTEITQFVGKLLTISDLGLIAADFSVTGEESATDPTAGANVDVGATFVGWGVGEDSGKKLVTKVPGIKAAYVDAQGGIDVTQADIADYLGEFLEAGDWKISDGESVSSWISGTLDK